MKRIKALAAAGLFLSAQFLLANDWPQYRGPSGDGKSTEKLSALPSSNPQPRWKTPTPNGFSSWVVAQGRAFLIVQRPVEGVPREVLLGVAADTGKELWAAPLNPVKFEGGGDSGTPQNSGGDGPRSSPAISGNRVFVVSADLILACFDAASGKEIWRRELIKQNGANNISWKNAASPVIDGDSIFVAGGGEGQSLMGISKVDGSIVWKGESDRITHATPIVATLGGVKQVIFYTQKGLVAVAPESGKVLWRHTVRYNVSTAASPVVAGEIVYCSAGYGVGATAVQVSRKDDTFTATELWKVTGNKIANHWSTPIEKDGYLYGMFQFKEYGEGPIKCVDLRTGQEKWSQAGFGPGQVIMVGDQLIALSDAGQVVVIDPTPEAYKEKARFQAVTGKCWSTPAFANGTLFVRSTREGAAFDFSQKLSSR